ncbi:acetate--CoA ligase family protein [Iamia majanohamensis]|uniref:Acetate--CoA ligase family protein n=1 Tax=Iamia majanohamensis TaxID=467976 RepID=A0AAE9YE73_9ACTN|nr:acetate--CoA ligase family protein [Iamia majanohamensis]WCO69194.1 acetate--CoA ligase family protein [Iamia majanohamensis]
MSPQSSRTLSEAASKALLRGHGVPLLDEREVTTAEDAAKAAEDLGLPVVVKLCGDAIAHKTERGLVRLGLADVDDVARAGADLLAAATPEDGDVSLLVAPMVKGNRELIAGVSRDPQFGPTVLLGVGGILAEAVGDAVVRLVPLSRADAEDMVDGLATQALLGPFRGEPAVDRDALCDVLLGLSAAAEADPGIASIDLNPLIVVDGRPVAVDALVERSDDAGEAPTDARGPAAGGRPAPTAEQFRALFAPRGVIVAGASTHPGKFGFVSLHNILASGYEGEVFATNRDGAEVLGVQSVPDVDQVPEGRADLVFVCTPAGANPDLLRKAAAKGVRAAFITSAGYGEAGEEGRAAQDELVALCDELGILLAGPNGQGVVSTPVSLCAQIVAPNPPAGRIGVASQSGNFVSSFENLAMATGVGISRAVSAGNAAAVTVPDYLEHYAEDPATAVGLAYVEGVPDGAAFARRIRSVAARKPLVLLKGGATAGGQSAAASHTGSLATDDRVFDGACRQAGASRATSVEDAFEAAATFATQPLPAGPRTAVLTTAGGWGVVCADAITRSDLVLAPLPDDLRAAIDEKLPPRWSRANPVDLAGGETRDTIPEVMALIAEHPEVDALIYLGLGIQANQARLMRQGSFHPDHGIGRIVDYHERQDARFAQAAADTSDATGKPVLCATELAVADPDNAGPATVRATGRLCYPSADRAVRALEHLWRRARFLDRHRG